MENHSQVALVTGGARGIGAAIVHKLAAGGFNVVINYKNSSQAANQLAQEVTSRYKIKALPCRADVFLSGDVAEMISRVKEEWGRIDVLVNNAGIARDALLARMTEDDWDQVINTNLKGVFNCTKAVLKTMQKQCRGRVINIASVVGQKGQMGQSNYAAAKAGVIAFSKSLALELARWDIKVNVVVPCFTETDMTAKLSAGARERILAHIPSGRPGSPQDVANMVNFLTSEEAGYISGQVFNVDCRVV
ncbi:MAG: 3-oxoacyl-ACP reductase FabG [Firmicutes bacterium]|nr:3-oxoacyl-ACP reductase FabG [Bacillota bacterium]